MECELYGKPDGKGEVITKRFCHVAVPSPDFKKGMGVIVSLISYKSAMLPCKVQEVQKVP